MFLGKKFSLCHSLHYSDCVFYEFFVCCVLLRDTSLCVLQRQECEPVDAIQYIFVLRAVLRIYCFCCRRCCCCGFTLKTNMHKVLCAWSICEVQFAGWSICEVQFAGMLVLITSRSLSINYKLH